LADRPLVLILSTDDLLRELLSERFRQDHLEVLEAGNLAEAKTMSQPRVPSVVVIDAISEYHLVAGLLDDPYTVFEEGQPPFMLLAGSATPVAIRDHGWIDRVAGIPLSADGIVEAALYCASGRARREMKSGVRMRSAVNETFKTKKTSLQG